MRFASRAAPAALFEVPQVGILEEGRRCAETRVDHAVRRPGCSPRGPGLHETPRWPEQQVGQARAATAIEEVLGAPLAYRIIFSHGAQGPDTAGAAACPAASPHRPPVRAIVYPLLQVPPLPGKKPHDPVMPPVAPRQFPAEVEVLPPHRYAACFGATTTAASSAASPGLTTSSASSASTHCGRQVRWPGSAGPRSSGRTPRHVAPAARASATVASVEPPSATMTSSAHRTLAMHASMRLASSRVGMTTVTGPCWIDNRAEKPGPAGGLDHRVVAELEGVDPGEPLDHVRGVEPGPAPVESRLTHPQLAGAGVRSATHARAIGGCSPVKARAGDPRQQGTFDPVPSPG